MRKRRINLPKVKCPKCGEKVSQNDIKKIPSGNCCKKCYAKKRAERRDMLLHDVAGVRRRSEILEEAKKRREEREKRAKIIKSTNFIIKGEVKRKVSSTGRRISGYGLYITRDEKSALYMMLVQRGYTSDEANKEIKTICEKMDELGRRLREKQKSQKIDINTKFKEEFAKMCASYRR